MSSETEYSLITFKVAHETVFPFLDDAKELKKLLLHRFRWQSVVSVRDLTVDSRSIKGETPLNHVTFCGPDDVFTKYLWMEHQIFDADVISTPNGWKLDLPMPRKKDEIEVEPRKIPKFKIGDIATVTDCIKCDNGRAVNLKSGSSWRAITNAFIRYYFDESDGAEGFISRTCKFDGEDEKVFDVLSIEDFQDALDSDCYGQDPVTLCMHLGKKGRVEALMKTTKLFNSSGRAIEKKTFVHIKRIELYVPVGNRRYRLSERYSTATDRTEWLVGMEIKDER